ncbi:hypothetical protein RIF29_20509 [Crotalaria pallida]|uniref:Uncharacterized protein n=1 Tax=Crotalaria pallida TaxID=3830 RepID=A0AAN9F3L4_CROPI
MEGAMDHGILSVANDRMTICPWLMTRIECQTNSMVAKEKGEDDDMLARNEGTVEDEAANEGSRITMEEEVMNV